MRPAGRPSPWLLAAVVTNAAASGAYFAAGMLPSLILSIAVTGMLLGMFATALYGAPAPHDPPHDGADASHRPHARDTVRRSTV